MDFVPITTNYNVQNRSEISQHYLIPICTTTVRVYSIYVQYLSTVPSSIVCTDDASFNVLFQSDITRLFE